MQSDLIDFLFHFCSFLSSFLFTVLLILFPFSSIFFLCILLVWNCPLFSILLSFPLSERVRNKQKQRRQFKWCRQYCPLNPFNQHMPTGWWQETTILPSVVPWATPVAATHMLLRVCTSYCMECFSHTTWLQRHISSFLRAQVRTQQFFSTLEKTLWWNVVSSLVLLEEVSESGCDYVWVSCWADSCYAIPL